MQKGFTSLGPTLVRDLISESLADMDADRRKRKISGNAGAGPLPQRFCVFWALVNYFMPLCRPGQDPHAASGLPESAAACTILHTATAGDRGRPKCKLQSTGAGAGAARSQRRCQATGPHSQRRACVERDF
jgi:hypothetical protein